MSFSLWRCPPGLLTLESLSKRNRWAVNPLLKLGVHEFYAEISTISEIDFHTMKIKRCHEKCSTSIQKVRPVREITVLQYLKRSAEKGIDIPQKDSDYLKISKRCSLYCDRPCFNFYAYCIVIGLLPWFYLVKNVFLWSFKQTWNVWTIHSK